MVGMQKVHCSEGEPSVAESQGEPGQVKNFLSLRKAVECC
jgi:hypothetical protein